MSEAGEIMKIYFVTYNTPVIDLLLEYISPRPWYCTLAKAPAPRMINGPSLIQTKIHFEKNSMKWDIFLVLIILMITICLFVQRPLDTNLSLYYINIDLLCPNTDDFRKIQRILLDTPFQNIEAPGSQCYRWKET